MVEARWDIGKWDMSYWDVLHGTFGRRRKKDRRPAPTPPLDRKILATFKELLESHL